MIGDFITSVKDGRVFRQVSRMEDSYENHAVIIVGNPIEYIHEENKKANIIRKKNRRSKYRFNFTVKQYNAVYVSLQLVTNVFVVDNFQQALQVIDFFFSKSVDGKNRLHVNPEKPSKNTALNYLNNIPDIGKKTATLICEELDLNTLEDLFRLNMENLTSLPKIGDKTAKVILKEIFCEKSD